MLILFQNRQNLIFATNNHIIYFMENTPSICYEMDYHIGLNINNHIKL